MRVTSPVALKEWAVLCARLGAGEQSVLVRKGGIREPRAAVGEAPTFTPEHSGFWLLPTYFHAREPGRDRDLAPAARTLLPQVLADAPPPGRLRLQLWAEVDLAVEVRDLAHLDALADVHGLSVACVADRFAYRRPGLWVLLLRTYRTRQAIELPDLAEYAGCHSWVDLAEVVAGDVDPVLSDQEHDERRAALRSALER
ncbi:DUF1802 family protein [Nannocystis radixulma]|uniref:DUF1802 family protein n=1 Tax=Nannocystis radixulma TaxID=2995305 RepID=A0ABT5BGR4_9BACT|nr:DUF1802 family protein [Nannocystis radixulma]MDC0673331.1 DUF1802 family protein [Nannocystis radixulma]